MKKKILVIGLILLLIMGTVFGIISYADDSKLYVSLSEEYLLADGTSAQIGYGIGNPKTSPDGTAKIWYLRTHNSNKDIIQQRNLYCVKANYGDTWNRDEETVVTYNLSYNLQSDRRDVFTKLNNFNLVEESKANDIVAELLDPSKESYRQVLWILDNSYIAGQTDKTEFLTKAGITTTAYNYLLTDQDINAIQRAAIWYYTNFKLDGDTIFDKTNKVDWLNITKDGGNSYTALVDYEKFGTQEGKARDEQAKTLYHYLINSAESNKGIYTAANNYTLPVNSIKVNDKNLEVNTNKSYELGAERTDGGYLIAGPIKMVESNNGDYDLTLTVSNTQLQAIEYKITNATGEDLQYESLKDLTQLSDGFYIKVATSVATEFNISIGTRTETTTKTLWLNGSETQVTINKTIRDNEGNVYEEQEVNDAIELLAEQPIVEVTRTGESKSIVFSVKEELIDIPVTKVWEDNSDERGERPESIEIALKANGQTIKNHTLTGTGDTWTYTFTNLPVKQNGVVIVYTVEEVNPSDEYTSSIIGSPQEGFTITNTIIEEKVFDLALRKYITKINNTLLTDLQIPQRVPTVQENSLVNGTTATYQHKKDPVYVEMGDIVTYQIRIYNEGQKTGYASQIIDQLPTGLIYNPSSTIVSKDSTGNDKNTYTVTYDPQSGGDNKITFDIVNTSTNPAKDLNAYVTGNMDYETLEIQCKVIHEPQLDDSNILTNVAWISGEYDTEDGIVATDRDSQTESTKSPNVKKGNMEDYKGDLSNKNDLTDSTYFYKGQQDDDDFEKLYVKIFDLALRKFITAVDGIEYNGREPVPDVTPLTDIWDTTTTAEYNHPKTPVPSKIGDKIIYTIRVYNEGEIDGYASEVKDYLPPHLEFVRESQINTRYGWSISNDGRIATTTYLSDKEISKFNGTTLDYEDIQIECKILNTAVTGQSITNIAEISEYKYGNTVVPRDIDSESDNMKEENNIPEDNDLPNYKKDEENNRYVPGNEDDDDFEKVYVEIFDLSLRKFITAIDGNEITEREPVVDVTPLKDNLETTTTAIYNHPKTPVSAKIGDKIVYTIRVYNEGEIDGCASEVKDYLPPHLEFVTDSTINTTYGWTISDNGRIATTKYLANKEISKFNGTTLDYEDIKIECKILNTAITKQSITNIAEISEYKYNGIIFAKDIDSESDNMTLPEDNKLPDYKKEQENDTYVPGNEDDDDFEKVYVKAFDLALRKFITAIDAKDVTGREPVVDVSPLKDNLETTTTAIYNHPKTPVLAKVGDRVVYTIRVYNEGEIDGYASEVKDYLPPHLQFIKDSAINTTYGWTISDNGRVATTKYLANKEISKFNGTTLDYEDIEIECKILDTAVAHQSITNIAEISEYKYNGIIFAKDIDSESDNMTLPEDNKLPDYKKEQENDTYVPGNEDDDDFEKVYVKEFDLALRKFITKVQEAEVTVRIPQVKINEGKISYEHPKDAVLVHVGDRVEYTIRVYNEGEINGYASEIADDIPEYLEFLPEDTTNTDYMWKMYDKNGAETEKIEEAVRVKTQFLSKENSEDNLLVAFNGTDVAYKDIKIAFKVKDPNSNQYIITNHAQITDDTDEDGDKINDKDSITDEWNDGEDDQDFENIRVQYFDLALLKYVTKVIVIEDGVEKITETGYNGLENPEPVVKVELHRKKLSDVVVKFGYGIKIINEGDIAGYATEITDYIPEGLKFVAEDNPTWKDEGNNVISTKQLEGTLLQPGESATVEVILTWINGENNLMEKTNIAEISADDNEYNIDDRDSTPDNKKDEEDDIDIAKVILTISTGAVKTYFKLAIGLLLIIAVGIILIKRFVL